MNYSLSDIIQKIIDIEKEFFNVYVKIEEQWKNKSPLIYAVTKAIEKQEKKHIEYYEELKKELKGNLNEDIEFYLYDRVAKLFYQFREYIQFPEIKNPQDLIQYAVEFEKNTIGLLLDIRGRLLESIDDVNNNIYRILSIIIKEEEKHEKMFEQLLISK